MVVANKLEVKFLQVRSSVSNNGHEIGKRGKEGFCDPDLKLCESVIKERVKYNADIRDDKLLVVLDGLTAYVVLGNAFTSEM